MKKEITELVYILDRSGSMAGLEDDTIGGYNSMLKKQKESEGEVYITTVLFDDRLEMLHDRVALTKVQPLTDKEYFVRGSTALLDATGFTIQKIRSHQNMLPEDQKSDKVLFVITTDGYENASHEYNYAKVRDLISQQKDKDGWEFIFMGANIDAVKEAAKFGINANRATQYINDNEGVQLNFQVVSNVASQYRMGKSISEDWMAPIEADAKKRKKR